MKHIIIFIILNIFFMANAFSGERLIGSYSLGGCVESPTEKLLVNCIRDLVKREALEKNISIEKTISYQELNGRMIGIKNKSVSENNLEILAVRVSAFRSGLKNETLLNEVESQGMVLTNKEGSNE